MRGILLFMISTLIVFFGAAYGNIGNYEVLNGPLEPGPLEHAAIVMTAETVTCILNNDRVSVDAVFIFFNNGPATEADMYFPVGIQKRDTGSAGRGFSVSDENPVVERPFFAHRPDLVKTPVKTGGIQFAVRPGINPPEKYFAAITSLGDPLDRLGNYDTLTNFRVLADGVPVNTETVERIVLTEELYEEGEKAEERAGGRPYGKRGTIVRWRLLLGEGETIEIRCRYEVSYDEARYLGRPDVFKYSIYTGKGWAGPIGEGLIKVIYSSEELGAPVWFAAPGLSPGGVTVSENATTISWFFSDFEPGSDAEVLVLIGRNRGTISTSEENENVCDQFQYGPGIVLAKRVALKTEPSNNSPAVKKGRKLKKKTLFNVYNSVGEWWHVKLNDGTEGWLRWREVNPDTGEERLNAAFAYYLTE
jgi:hypothetical protein